MSQPGIRHAGDGSGSEPEPAWLTEAVDRLGRLWLSGEITYEQAVAALGCDIANHPAFVWSLVEAEIGRELDRRMEALETAP